MRPKLSSENDVPKNDVTAPPPKKNRRLRSRDVHATDGNGMVRVVCHNDIASLFLYGALDSHPFFPPHVASGRCVLSAAAAGAPADVVSAFAEPPPPCASAGILLFP